MNNQPGTQLCLPCYDHRENGARSEECQCHRPPTAVIPMHTQKSQSYSLNLGFITDPATRCKECRGNLVLKQDMYGKYEECLMCGTIANDQCD